MGGVRHGHGGTGQIGLRRLTANDTVEVRIMGFPLDIQQTANSWHDELLREFALVSLAAGDGTAVPRRLLELVEATRAHYSEFTEDVEHAQLEMHAGGLHRGDFSYHVPPSIASACADLDDALDRAEAFCETGNLLTMRPPAVVTAFRRWMLGEFVRQIRDGARPLAWDDYVRAGGLAAV
ncbi:MAG: hypothetical protein QOI42_544 [Frankiaceae bacterium]|nr:hypothetical protein [Frankiaceae bacterium]